MDDFSEVVVKIYKNIHTAIGLRAILLEGNTDEHRQIFKNTDARHTRMMMQECLVTALTFSLSRVYERSQRNNSSLRRAFLLLEREEFITFIERTGISRIRDVFKVEVREAIGLLNTQWHDHAMRSQQAIDNLLALRTYILAHSLAGSDYITPPTYREVFSLIDPAAEIVIKLGWFSDPHLQNVAGVSERWHRSGREFCDAALRGMRASAG